MRTRLTQFFQRKFVRDTLTLQAGKVGVLTMSLAASVIVPVVMGPAVYGQWQLVVSLYGTWQFLNLTGVIVSAQTRLAAAVGADNADEVLNILGVSVRLTLLYCALSTLLLWAVAGLTPVAGWLYDGDSSIIWLAVLLTLTQPTELLYQLVIVTFSSRRQMSHVAAMQNANQFIFVGATIIAVLIRPRPATLVAARLIYSLLTLSIILVVYQRTRAHTQLTYPSLMTVVRAVPTASSSGYWRFGVTNALDKNTGNLFAYLPVQMAGASPGTRLPVTSGWRSTRYANRRSSPRPSWITCRPSCRSPWGAGTTRGCGGTLAGCCWCWRWGAWCSTAGSRWSRPTWCRFWAKTGSP